MSISNVPTTNESPWQIAGDFARLQSSALRAEFDLANPTSGLKILAVGKSTPKSLTLFRVGLPHQSSSLSALLKCVEGAAMPHVSPSPLTGERRGEGEALPLTTSESQHAVEFFVRGNDLIATYSETAEYPFRAQIYWRFNPPRRTTMKSQRSQIIADVELILSIQTSLLDSDPMSMVETELNAAQASRLVDPPSSRLEHLSSSVTPLVLDPTTGNGCFLFRLADAPLVYAEMIHPADFHRSTIKPGAGNESSLCLSHQLFPQRLEKGVILRSRIRSFFTLAETELTTIARAYQDFAASAPPLTV